MSKDELEKKAASLLIGSLLKSKPPTDDEIESFKASSLTEEEKSKLTTADEFLQILKNGKKNENDVENINNLESSFTVAMNRRNADAQSNEIEEEIKRQREKNIEEIDDEEDE